MDARQRHAPTHDCIAGERCRAATPNDHDEWIPALTEHPASMCDACRNHHTDAIKQLPRDWAELLVTIGDRQAARGDVVHSTPSPAVLLNATNDRLMVDIAEWIDIAAALIARRRDMTKPDGARRPPLHVAGGRKAPPAVGSLALRTWDHLTNPRMWETLSAQHSMVLNNIETLAAEPETTIRTWAHPARCSAHQSVIAAAQEAVDNAPAIPDRDEAQRVLERARLDAALCDTCNGWGPTGQARIAQTTTGIQVLQKLTNLHHLTRKHLGHTRLRHTYTMPCPRCGYPTGRDDGTTIINCDNPNCTPRGRSSWTERDYDWLTGVVIEGNTEMWLTKEAYHRLDQVQNLIDKLDGDQTIDLPGAGTVILERLQAILAEGAGHQRPADREPSTDRKTAVEQDRQSWKTEPRYEKPPTKPRTPTDIGITGSSLTTITDIDLNTTAPQGICPTCHLTRPCDCEE